MSISTIFNISRGKKGENETLRYENENDNLNPNLNLNINDNETLRYENENENDNGMLTERRYYADATTMHLNHREKAQSYQCFCPFRAHFIACDYPGRCPGLGADGPTGRKSDMNWELMDMRHIYPGCYPGLGADGPTGQILADTNKIKTATQTCWMAVVFKA